MKQELSTSAPAPHTNMNPFALNPNETIFTAAEAPASANFKEAARLGGIAALGVAHNVGAAVSERRAMKEGYPSTINPLNQLMATGAVVAGVMAAHAEVKAGLAKRRAAKHQ